MRIFSYSPKGYRIIQDDNVFRLQKKMKFIGFITIETSVGHVPFSWYLHEGMKENAIR